MKRLILSVLLLLLCCVPQFAQTAVLPSSQTWLDHLDGGLMKFWNHPDAFGSPTGAFPTFRCDDGSLLDYKNPCPPNKGNSYLTTPVRSLVALSRQTYGYGVAFHMTGNKRYLELMKAGVDYIRANAVDRKDGGMFTSQDPMTGVWGPKMEFRNPQELGYGLLGMAFYYYLTRDPEVLPDIVAIREHIMTRYYRPDVDALGWVLAPNGGDRPDQLKLVAMLDQMNTYHVLLAPILPEPHGELFRWETAKLARMIMYNFYSPSQNLFFLNANGPDDFDISKNGADFGHTAKAMWMIRWAGRITGDADLVRFAEDNAPALFERAYLPETGSWAQEVLPRAVINPDKNWWIYAELDQLAATLALKDRSFARYLPQTYEYWLKYFVDPVYGEVWNGVSAKNNAPIKDFPKQWQWKNAYHSLEHALISYITTTEFESKPLTLYYAFPQATDLNTVHPYFYDATRTGVQRLGDGTVAVTFTGIR